MTTVYVTHDQVEAMTLGQRVAVLRDGVLQQCDTRSASSATPTNLFVAAFIGSPSMNVVDATVGDGRVSFAGLSLPLPQGAPFDDAPRDVILGIRPTDLRHTADAAASQPRIRVRPDLVEELGGVTNVLFPIDAPRVQTDATRAAIEATSDDEATLLADDRRARFCASIDGRRPVMLGERPRARRRPSASALLRPRDGGRNQSPQSGGGVSPRAVPSLSSVASSTAPPMPVGVVTARRA